MEEVDSRLMDQRWRTLLHRPKMTSVMVRRIVRYQPTGDALFPAASRAARRPRPVDMSAINQRLRCASIHTTCMWCADAPAANGVTAEQPWHDLVVAGQGRTMPRLGVLAATALVWSLINRQAQSYSSLHEWIPKRRQVASGFQCRVCGWAYGAVEDERNRLM